MKLGLFFHLAFLLMITACTGQRPADIKNSTRSNTPIKGSCSDIKFEGKVLSKKNLTNIFDCSGWGKAYPSLFERIKQADQTKIDKVFHVLNQKLFATKGQRKNFFELIIDSEKERELDAVSVLIEKSLYDHNILGQLNLVLNSRFLNSSEQSDFMKIFSHKNEVNLINLKSLKKFAGAFEKHKSELIITLEAESHEDFRKRIISFLNDLSHQLDKNGWSYISKMIYDNGSILKDWSVEGLHSDLSVLLGVLEDKKFSKDLGFIKNSIDKGIMCENTADKNPFFMDIKQELKQKVESIKNDSREDFEHTLLYGYSKYVAFQEFCQEEKKQQGLKSFANIVEYCFKVTGSEHDFNFLKGLHRIFGEDRFAMISFLNSDSFKELRELLITLVGDDQKFVRSLYQILSEIPDKDLENVGYWVHELSDRENQTLSWYRSWSKIWDGLGQKEKNDFVDFLGLISEVRTDLIFNFMIKIFEEFPEISSSLSDELGDSDFQSSLRYVVSELSNTNVQKDLSGFLSEKGLFEFLKIVSYSKGENASVTSPIVDESHELTSYVIDLNSERPSNTRLCFEDLSKRYQQNPSYYMLVNTLPDICLNSLGQAGFVGQIYLWMNSSQKYFKEVYGVDDFHTAVGVWSPGMLHFIFTAAVKADHVLVSSNGRKGIKENLTEIYETVTLPQILEAFHLFTETYVLTSSKIQFESKLQKFLEIQSDGTRTRLTKNLFSVLKERPNMYPLPIIKSSCKNLSFEFGVDPCTSENNIAEKVIEIARILKRKDDTKLSLIQELIRWIHPQGGISLPFNKIEKDKYRTSFNEIVHFLYDLSSEKTMKDFIYKKDGQEKKLRGTTIDRLEVVIREIAFNNNFYGAYFKNQVAGAEDYREDVSGSRKLLTWLGRFSGPMRDLGGMDRDSKWRLKNVKQTFSALIEISDQYSQKDGTQRTYSNFIQSLLAAISASSKLKTQSFSAYRLPKNTLVEGHNGVFLTKIVELSGLRHLSQFVRSHFGDLSSLDTPEFKQIDKNILARHDLGLLQNGAQEILDNYLDHDRNQLNIFLQDLVMYISSLNDHNQKLVEEILFKGLILLADEKISTRNIQIISEGFMLLIKMWPEIRDILIEIKDPEKLLDLINSIFDTLIYDTHAVDDLLKMLIDSKSISSTDLELLLEDQEFRVKLKNLLNHLSTMEKPHTSLNWYETFKFIFASEDFRWEPILTWLETSMNKKPEHKLTLSLLLKFLGEKSPDGYRLKSIMDELLINHPKELEQFLSETFPALQFKTE